MKIITIINAYGQKNLGDAAIQESAMYFINEALTRGDSINLLTVDTDPYRKKESIKPALNQFIDPYGYSIKSSKKSKSDLIKILRFMKMTAGSLFYIILSRISTKLLPHKGDFAYIKALYEANMVIGMGGGYFLTKRKFRDYFGLLLTIMPLIISKIYRKKIIIFPISFGPFADNSHQQIAYNALKNTTVIARNYITLNTLNSLNKDNKLRALYAPDLALFLEPYSTNNEEQTQGNYYTLTAREWFTDKSKQKQYEESLVKFIDAVWEKERLETVFIPMARNSVEDDDNKLAQRLKEKLRNKQSFKIINPKNLRELQKLFGCAKFSVCTRMHSAILSSIELTPFIPIGYGHKTLGFVETLGLKKWYIDINDINYNLLFKKYLELAESKNYYKFIQTVKLKQREMQKYRNTIINELRNINTI